MLPSFDQLSFYHNAQERTGVGEDENQTDRLGKILEASNRLNGVLERYNSEWGHGGTTTHPSAQNRRESGQYDAYEQTPLKYDKQQSDRLRGDKSACKRPGCEGNTEQVSAERALCPVCNVEQLYPSENMTPRSNAGDTAEKREGRMHNQLYSADQRHKRTHITVDEFNKGVSPENLELANTRLNQCRIWFNDCLSDAGVLRPFWLTDNEITRALHRLRAVCKQFAVTGKHKDSGSTIFWVLALTLQLVSERPQGFNVSSPSLQKLLTMSGLHAALSKSQGRKVSTDESQQAATKASGSGIPGQNHLDKTKYRQLKLDSLGDKNAQLGKMVFLNTLLVQAQISPLSTVVLKLEKPGLLPPPPRPPPPPPPRDDDDFMKALLAKGNYSLVARTGEARPSRKLGPGRNFNAAGSRPYLENAPRVKLTDTSVVEHVFAQLRL